MKRLVIVEDQTAIREMLVEILRLEPGYELVGQTGDGQSAVDLCLAKAPDICILDAKVPGLNGVEILRHNLPAGTVDAAPVSALPASAAATPATDPARLADAGTGTAADQEPATGSTGRDQNRGTAGNRNRPEPEPPGTGTARTCRSWNRTEPGQH